MRAHECLEGMEELQHIFRGACLRRIHGGIEQGGYDNAVDGAWASGFNGRLELFQDWHKRRVSRGLDRNERQIGDRWMSETFREVKGMAEGGRLFVR